MSIGRAGLKAELTDFINRAPSSSAIRVLVIFKMRNVAPHKALGLILDLNFQRIIEKFAEHRARKILFSRFGLFFKN